MARILVADDEEGIRAFVAEALEADGHSVAQAADGREAELRLAERGFDLLISDLKMPRLDGMALLRKVRAEQPEVEIIVLTAYGTVDSAVEAMKLGALDYLQKPIGSPAELRLLVSRALERRSLLALRDRTSRDAEAEEPMTWGDPAMKPVLAALRKVAATPATVLLLGESGTGKEVAARAIHRWSARTAGPFVAVNCAALPENLLESELFGHEKGAFTGAHARRRGRVELAEGGTFFLDEVAELRPDLQTKLLRVLQERCFERVGGAQTIEADVRWIAATNRDLRAMMDQARFREDLYHRLAVFPIVLPPLRERRGDIPPLAAALLRQIGREIGRPGLRLDPDAERRIAGETWQGNVRELRNALERAAILSDGDTIREEHLAIEAHVAGPAAARAPTLAELEREAIRQALAETAGNRRRAAERLGIGLRTLYEKLKQFDIG
ncbi:MAG: sigma-54 dependent transcriptional regulator [Myxococcota bacterium]|nr:sigma-54 dependent transcriptional regulator [Myxococcota bacterium]